VNLSKNFRVKKRRAARDRILQKKGPGSKRNGAAVKLIRYFKTSVAWRVRNPIETTLLQDVLLMVNVDLPRELLCRWSVQERAIVEDWACRLHLRASDNIVRVPPKPDLVTRAERLAKKLPKPDYAASTIALMEKRSANPTGTIYDLIGGGR
jgi:hypothetical protein